MLPASLFNDVHSPVIVSGKTGLRGYTLMIVLIFASLGVLAQQVPPRLIVRGDDMGYSHSGNEAILKCSKEGIQTSVEIIVPSPWFPEAVRMLAENPSIDVGIHLALSSEWSNVKWRPVSDAISIRDEDGYFFPMIWPNKSYPGQALNENRWTLPDIEKEFRAQIELALRKLPRISHVSSHMGCTDMNDSVRLLTTRLAKEYHIDIDLQESGVEYVSYEGLRKTSAGKIAGFLKMLDKLKPGHTYLFVDHPGIDNAELRAIHHIGYEDVATDRQGVTDTWTHPSVKKRIHERNIQLISYSDLRK
jgi:predicted glycoside hydrolase/deacetylase ChbG (UPF0249 family)